MKSSDFTSESLCESGCFYPLAAINLDLPAFNSEYGESAFPAFKHKLELLGFIYRGIIEDSAIFAYPSPTLDDLLDEFTRIIDHGC